MEMDCYQYQKPVDCIGHLCKLYNDETCRAQMLVKDGVRICPKTPEGKKLVYEHSIGKRMGDSFEEFLEKVHRAEKKLLNKEKELNGEEVR